MKIIQNNDSELEIRSNGTGSLVAGAILSIVGVGATAAPLFTSAEWWVSIVGVVVIGIAGALIATAANSVITLRRGGMSAMTEKRIIGGKTKEATFDTTQVTQIRLESHTEYDVSSSSESGARSGQQQRQRISTMFAVLNDGTEITLGSERVNGNGGFALNGVGLSSVSGAPLSTEAKQIADFLGVPVSTGLQNVSLQDVVGAARSAFTQTVPQPEFNPTVQSLPVAPGVAATTPQITAQPVTTEPAVAPSATPPAESPTQQYPTQPQ